jgi:hypothetical protein
MGDVIRSYAFDTNSGPTPTIPHRRLTSKTPTATAAVAVAWSLGNEKSVVLESKTWTLSSVSYGQARSTALPMSWPMPRAMRSAAPAQIDAAIAARSL